MKSKVLPKVLIVEDMKSFHRLWNLMLHSKIELLSAISIDEAEKSFADNPDVAAIAMDGCVPGRHINTLPLVRKMRETFKGPMIAIASDYDHRKELMQAGCDYEVDKNSLPEKLIEVLRL